VPLLREVRGLREAFAAEASAAEASAAEASAAEASAAEASAEVGRLAAEVGRLAAEAARALGCGSGLGAAEAVIRAGMLKLGGGVLAKLLGADPGYRGPRVDCGAGHQAEFISYRDKVIDTVLGPVTITRAWYHCADCKHGLAPRDAELGVTAVSMSPGLAAMNDQAAAAAPFAKAAGLLEGHVRARRRVRRPGEGRRHPPRRRSRPPAHHPRRRRGLDLDIATGKFPGATQIVDLFHAREHLHDLARLLEFMLLDRKDEWLAATDGRPGLRRHRRHLPGRPRLPPRRREERRARHRARLLREQRPPDALQVVPLPRPVRRLRRRGKPAAKRSSGSASNSPACAGPPPAQTPSPPSAASRPAGPKTACGSNALPDRHRLTGISPGLRRTASRLPVSHLQNSRAPEPQREFWHRPRLVS
jgi:hypothetical protein